MNFRPSTICKTTQGVPFLDVSPRGLIRVSNAEYRCALGPAGVVTQKQEGDGGSPIGCFPLRSVMYRPDRLTAPKTFLPVNALRKNDIWCNDPTHADYNRLASRPHPASHEPLWRDDDIYNIIVEIGYNDDPPIPGVGSAIFIHVARTRYSYTEGCLALNQEDLLAVLLVCGPQTMLRINLR